jgi:hypothetical protein
LHLGSTNPTYSGLMVRRMVGLPTIYSIQRRRYALLKHMYETIWLRLASNFRRWPSVCLQGSFQQVPPPHAPKAVTAGPEDCLDPAADSLHAIVPALESPDRGVPWAASGADLNDFWDPTFGQNGGHEHLAAIATVGESIARIIRQSAMTGMPVVNVAGGHGELLDKSRVGISSDVSLEPVNGFASPMACVLNEPADAGVRKSVA